VLTIIWPLPTFAFWVAILMTVAGLVTITNSKPLKVAFSFNVVIGVIVLLLLSNLLVSYVATFVSFSSLGSLVVDTLRFPLLILFGVVAFRLPWKKQ
ncbi:DNA mismatch repair protein MutT, partial [Vibrio makurazakiensis]